MRLRRLFPRRRLFSSLLGLGDRPPEGWLYALRQANSCMNHGDYLEAGEAFRRLAETAEPANRSRTVQFYLQAASAFIRAGDVSRAMDLAKNGVECMVRLGYPRTSRWACRRFLYELESLGLNQEAARFTGWLSGIPDEPAPERTQAVQEKHARVPLPVSCPSCGGPLRPDEVEWVDSITAECTFCGSLVRGEVL